MKRSTTKEETEFWVQFVWFKIRGGGRISCDHMRDRVCGSWSEITINWSFCHAQHHHYHLCHQIIIIIIIAIWFLCEKPSSVGNNNNGLKESAKLANWMSQQTLSKIHTSDAVSDKRWSKPNKKVAIKISPPLPRSSSLKTKSLKDKINVHKNRTQEQG